MYWWQLPSISWIVPQLPFFHRIFQLKFLMPPIRATFSAIPTPLNLITLKYCLKSINVETLNYKPGSNYSSGLESHTCLYAIFLNTINPPTPPSYLVIILHILLRLKIIVFLIIHFFSSPCSHPLWVEILSWVPCSHAPSNLLQGQKARCTPTKHNEQYYNFMLYLFI